MRVKRFVAEDTRTALQQVRAEQGADAVILSNKNTPFGIEIISATDFDEALFDSIRSKRAPAEAVNLDIGNSRPSDTRANDAPRGGESGTTARPVRRSAGVSDENDLNADVHALKALLEGQLSKLVWDADKRLNPHFTGQLKRLTRLSFEPSAARRLAIKLAKEKASIESVGPLTRLIEERVQFRGSALINDGGIVALVGPTGVGKTTTVAKIAARAALLHGAASVALISADAQRIGAHEQLGRFAALLGVEMFEAHGHREIRQLLSKLEDRRLVLIDTAGISQGDPALSQALRELASVSAKIIPLLTIAANSQFHCIDWTIRSYTAARPAGLVLTKIDEATHIAPALSALLAHPLGLEFVTDGQVVPDDLYLASESRDWLIERCLNPLPESTTDVDEDFLAQTFAGDNHVCI